MKPVKVTKEELYDLCGDFKDLVKGKYFDDYMTDLDIKLLNNRDCALFFKEKRLREEGIVEREEIIHVNRDFIKVRYTKALRGKLQEIKDSTRPLTDLKDYQVLLGANKVVMCEIGRYYNNRK